MNQLIVNILNLLNQILKINKYYFQWNYKYQYLFLLRIWLFFFSNKLIYFNLFKILFNISPTSRKFFFKWNIKIISRNNENKKKINELL